MTTMNMGDINRRLGLGSSAVNAEMLINLGFEPAGKDKRAVLFEQSDYPAICKALAKHIEGRASVPMQPKPEKADKAPAKGKAPPADDDEEL